MTTVPRPPIGLAARGRRLWREMHEAAEFNPAERVLLEEACRLTDRLEKLDAILRGDAATLVEIVYDHDGEPLRLAVDGVLAEARQQQNVLKQIVAALRIPDEAGKRPQRRGARGSYQPKGAGVVSSLDRARQAAGS